VRVLSNKKAGRAQPTRTRGSELKRLRPKRGRSIRYPHTCPVHRCLMVVEQTRRDTVYLICPVEGCRVRTKRKSDHTKRRRKSAPGSLLPHSRSPLSLTVSKSNHDTTIGKQSDT
jgi:hypothetical protein